MLSEDPPPPPPYAGVPPPDCREELLRDECSDWLLREEELSDWREDELRREAELRREEAELREVGKEWLKDDWMLGFDMDDCREGLLKVLCREAIRPGLC